MYKTEWENLPNFEKESIAAAWLRWGTRSLAEAAIYFFDGDEEEIGDIYNFNFDLLRK